METTQNISKRINKVPPQMQWEAYQQIMAGAKAGEVLTKYNISSNFWQKIKQRVETGALKELSINRKAKKIEKVVELEKYESLLAEKKRLEETLCAVTEENVLLKKKVNGV